MNKFNNKNDLLKYLEAVLDTELNLYMQNQLLVEINNTYRSLGNRKQISRPSPQKATVGIIGNNIMITGLISGIITAVLTSLVLFFFFRSQNENFILSFIDSVLNGIIFGVIGLFVFGLTLGTLIGCVRMHNRQKELDREYAESNIKYQKALEADNLRIITENLQKNRLSNDMALLVNRISESENNLKKMYGYAFLRPDYCNIYAVSSIYGYLKDERTHSLEFNEKTGDRGAYNIYQEERRLDKIITNTEEIIRQLDQVLENQRILADGLRRVEMQLDSLNQSVCDFAFDTKEQLNDIKNSIAITNYNTERSAIETGVLSWLALTR